MAVKNLYIDKIMERLHELNIYKVILFGSYAAGRADNESDIDLLIVLDEATLPENYEEWLEIKMRVRRLLRDIGRRVSAVERASQKLARNIEDTRQLYEVAKQRSSTGGLARRPIVQNCFAILDNEHISGS